MNNEHGWILFFNQFSVVRMLCDDSLIRIFRNQFESMNFDECTNYRQIIFYAFTFILHTRNQFLEKEYSLHLNPIRTNQNCQNLKSLKPSEKNSEQIRFWNGFFFVSRICNVYYIGRMLLISMRLVWFVTNKHISNASKQFMYKLENKLVFSNNNNAWKRCVLYLRWKFALTNSF